MWLKVYRSTFLKLRIENPQSAIAEGKLQKRNCGRDIWGTKVANGDLRMKKYGNIFAEIYSAEITLRD